MHTRAARRGKSLAPRIPRHLADEASLAVGRDAELAGEDGRLVVPPHSPTRTLDALVSGITAENLPEDLDDAARGAERL